MGAVDPLEPLLLALLLEQEKRLEALEQGFPQVLCGTEGTDEAVGPGSRD